jgi:hypothetical protein
MQLKTEKGRKMIVRIIILLFFYASASCFAQCDYPADISFCIADLKFDGQNIKFAN